MYLCFHAPLHIGWQVFGARLTGGKKGIFSPFSPPFVSFQQRMFSYYSKDCFFSDLQKSTFIFSDQLSFCFDMVEVQCNHHLQALLAPHLSLSLLKSGKYAKRTSTWFPKLFNLILVLILSFFFSIKFPKLCNIQEKTYTSSETFGDKVKGRRMVRLNGVDFQVTLRVNSVVGLTWSRYPTCSLHKPHRRHTRRLDHNL